MSNSKNTSNCDHLRGFFQAAEMNTQIELLKDESFGVITRCFRVIRYDYGDVDTELRSLDGLDSMKGILNPTIISDRGFTLSGTFRPSGPLSNEHQSKSPEIFATICSTKRPGDLGVRPSYSRVPLTLHRLEPCTEIDTNGLVCRVILPQKPKPSGCKIFDVNNLPLDIINQIFECLTDASDNCTAICLALTCRGFFNAYRSVRPGQMNIWSSTQIRMWAGPSVHTGEIIVGLKRVWLDELIKDWMAPKYRPTCGMPDRETCGKKPYWPVFVNREVYGDAANNVPSSKEVALKVRYDDWWKAGICIDQSKCVLRCFPHPYGKGDRWYEHAKMAIFRDAETRESWTGWVEFWLLHGTQVFGRITYMDRMKVADGFKDREEVENQKGRFELKMRKAKRILARHAKLARYQFDRKEREFSFAQSEE